jgi:hypothetical protein
MFHSLSRWFSRSVISVTLLSSACSGIAVAQVGPNAPLAHAQDMAARQQARPSSKLQNPAEQRLIAYLKSHASKTSQSTISPLDTGGTSYATTPPFGGYVEAPMFDARTTASLGVGVMGFTAVNVGVGGDFDKDGYPDIAVIQEDGTLNILTNDGKGGLKAPVSYLNPYYQTSTVFTGYAVDVNGDGYPDVVAFDSANDTTITWMNLGNGTFNAAVTTPIDTTYGYPDLIYLADVNGDGKADLIFGTISLNGTTSATVYLETQLGIGDGTFGAPSAAKVESFTYAGSGIMPYGPGIAVEDINGDGKVDIAVGIDERYSQSSGSYVVTTALGKGDGTFTGLGATTPLSIPTSGSFSIPYYSSILDFADVNGDGKLDLVADLNGTLETALGNGDGTFSPAVSTDISAVISPEDTMLLDVNGDGKLDAIVGGDTLSVYLGNGDGTFTKPVAGSQYVIDVVAAYEGLVVADFDNDGIKDVAELGALYKQVSLFSGTGKGGFRGAPLLTYGSDPVASHTALLTGGTYTNSGFSSPLVAYTGGNSTQLLTLLADGKGNFTQIPAFPTVPTNEQFIEPVHADFNGDGLEDLVYADTTGGVWVSLSKGDGTFATPVSIGFPPLGCVVGNGAAGDVNGDGKVDLVIAYGGDAACGSGAGGPSGYFVALGNGDGTFAKPTFVPVGTELYGVTLGDFNGDGLLDLAINDQPLVSGVGFQISVALGKGDGTFTAPNIVLPNYVVDDVAVADINNDGKDDLVLTASSIVGSGTSTAGIITITGNGDGTFNSPSMIATGTFFNGLQTVDMNNDGNIDIVATLFGTAAQPVNYYGMVTLLGYGNGQFAAPYNSLEGYATRPIVGHFVNDGALDVITASDSGTALFVGQGGSTLSLSTSAASINFGATETLTATVTPGLTGRPAATGTVLFYDGTTLLGTATVSSGTATLTLTTLTTGTHTVKAVYSGDTNFNPATSSASTITVAAVSAAFTVSGAPTSISVTGGAQGVVTLNLAANASFSGAVTLTCSGMPANGTCAVNPGSVTLTASGASTATLVIGTTSTHAELKRSINLWEAPTGAISLATLFALFLGKRKRVRTLAALVFGMVLSAATLLTGCGGNVGTVNKSSAPVVAPGSYTVTVTATPPSGSTASVQTATISLTVN